MKPIYFPSTDSFSDSRGEIWTSFDNSDGLFLANHVKFNSNIAGVFRGFHADNSTHKLTTCISGDIISFVVWPDNSQYEKFHLSSSLHSRLYIPPGFYNGFLCLEPSIYCYHLGYSGSYIDAHDQYTLSIEDSCVPIGEISTYFPINDIIRSARDS